MIKVDSIGDTWKEIVIPIDKLYYLGKGDKNLDKDKITQISILFQKVKGGKGRVGITKILFN